MNKKLNQRQIVLNSLKKQALISLKELTSEGISPSTVTRMLDNGEIIRTSRGIYRDKDNHLGKMQGIAEVAKRIPNGIICLTSALYLHEIIEESPEIIWVAVKKNSWVPKLDNPSIKIVQFTEKYISQCVVTKKIKGIPVKVFGVNKSVVDCFRLRNKIGMDSARRSLEQTIIKNYINQDEIFEFAQQGRVTNLIYPYLIMYTANSSIG